MDYASESESESAPAPDSLTLTLLDAICVSTGTTSTLPLVFEKQSPLPPDLVKPVWVDEEPTRPMPVRRHRLRTSSEVPNPVNTGIHDLPPNLTIKLGACIGHGRSGLVFKVQVEPIEPIKPSSPSGSSGSSSTNTPSTTPPPPPALPALVAKIGRQHFHKWLLREAWFYEEMQSLQGLVIPRCHGLYSARIPPAHVLLPWLEGWRLREFNAQPVSPDVLLHTYQARAGKDRADEREVEGEADMLDYFGDFDEKYAEFVRKFDEDTDTNSTSTSTEGTVGTGGTVCTLLILEELGGPYLPMGRRVPHEMREEILKAYAQIHELGIDHNDLTYWNILAAPSLSPYLSPSSSSSPSPSPSNPSRDSDPSHIDSSSSSSSSSPKPKHPPQPQPQSERQLRCRIIDFELASKMNITPAGLAHGSMSYLDRLLRNLPAGMVVGQNNK